MKIKYVGLKEAETAFSNETGITWEQGSVHEIDKADLCNRMLKHPDVFEAVTDNAWLMENVHPIASPAAVQGLSDAPVKTNAPVDDEKPAEGAPKVQMQTAVGVLDLSVLDKDQLHALAKEQGLSIHANAKAETVAARLAEAFPVTAEVVA